MSQENVEIVRRGFMAVLDDDWPTALTTLHPEIEVRDFDIPTLGSIEATRASASGSPTGARAGRNGDSTTLSFTPGQTAKS